MKILFCTNVFEIVENGPVKFAHLLLQINERFPEHELRILTEDITRPRPFVHKVPISRFWKSSPLSQFSRMGAYHSAAMRLRGDFPFDVLVYNNALVGLWSALRFKQTVGMINDDNNVSASGRKTGTYLTTLKHGVFGWVEGLMARKCHKVIVNSDYLRGQIAEKHRIAAHKIHRLYKAVEKQDDLPAPLTLDPSASIGVLFLKNDYQRGGLFTLIAALSLLPYRFTLTIVGPNSTDEEKIMASLANRTNLTGIFLGKVPQQSVTKLLKGTHIFCVPSYREALGVANMEAMALQVPVVSTWVGGIPEVLDYGRCGWLVTPHDAPALAAAIEECISQPQMRDSKVANAFEQVQKFDTQTMFENFLKILAH